MVLIPSFDLFIHLSLLIARGIAKASSAGFIASIAAHAKELTELKGDAVSKDDTPTISVEYGNKYVLLYHVPFFFGRLLEVLCRMGSTFGSEFIYLRTIFFSLST